MDKSVEDFLRDDYFNSKKKDSSSKYAKEVALNLPLICTGKLSDSQYFPFSSTMRDKWCSSYTSDICCCPCKNKKFNNIYALRRHCASVFAKSFTYIDKKEGEDYTKMRLNSEMINKLRYCFNANEVNHLILIWWISYLVGYADDVSSKAQKLSWSPSQKQWLVDRKFLFPRSSDITTRLTPNVKSAWSK